jgi:FXSXX-COOH protein
MPDIDDASSESEEGGPVLDVTNIPLAELLAGDNSALSQSIRRVVESLNNVHDVTARWSSRLP